MEIENLPKNTDSLEEHEMKIFENLYTKEDITQPDSTKSETDSECKNKYFEYITKIGVIIGVESFFFTDFLKKKKFNNYHIFALKVCLLIIFTVFIKYDNQKCNEFFTTAYNSVKSDG